MSHKFRDFAYLDEFVGAHLFVRKHSNKSIAGKSGMVVMETLKTFSILENGNVKVIPKLRGSFLLQSDEWELELNDRDLLVRPEDRMKDIRKLRKIVRKW
ncbi:MAG: ribonuclease P protein subunit [Thermoplasmataceae archaeon]